MGRHIEGMQMVLGSTEGRISSQVVESRSMQKKVAQEQELSGNKRCFACNETSHNLEECRIKYNLVTVAHQFGYATKVPFTMIQPSEEMVEKEKFYHHCLLITANVSNLDLVTLKGELQKLWNLSDGWVLRRECSTSFLASFSSEGDVVSSLSNTNNVEILLDDKEVQLTVARWMEGDEESSELIKQWFSVCGIPKIYRNWKQLYQVVSPFGVLIEVDEKSLEVGDKEPIRLKIALRSLDGAPFSYHYVVGWSTRMVMLTAEAKIDPENRSHNTRIVTSTGKSVLDFEECSGKEHEKEARNIVLEEATPFQESILDGNTKENEISVLAATVNNSNKTTIESSKSKGVPSISDQNSSTTIGEGQFKVPTKPPVSLVYKRRPKKQQVTKKISTSPSNTLDKTMGSESSRATRIGASEMERKRELNMEEIVPIGVSKNSEELVACRDKEDNSVTPAATTKSKQRQTSEDTSKTEKAQLVTAHTQGVSMDHMGSELQFHEKQYASTMDTRLPQNSEDNGTYESFSDMGLHENLLKGIYQYGLEKPSMVHQIGIVPLCKGLNVIHQSLSGTTVTLCCGVLQQLDYASTECQALILVPTQDLAQETKKVIEALGQFLGVQSHICAGGTSAHPDQQTLSSKVQVIVGTPFCILDMLQLHSLCPDHIRMLILDEADELLTGGSKDQIRNIIQNLPTKIQVGLFSADFSNEALETSRRFMDKTVTVVVPRHEELKYIKQFYIGVEKEEQKLGKLYTLLKTLDIRKAIIFVNTKDKVMSLTEDIGKNYTVSASHDDMHQHARDTAIQKFQSGSSSIHITTGLRGTNNVLQVPIVINYDLPTQLRQYIHRVQQKNGQPGTERVVVDLVTPADELIFSDIKSSCYTKVREIPSNV